MHSQWQQAAHPPPLTDEDVHVWRIVLDIGDSLRAQLRQHLSADEHQRAERFHFDNDRRHFIAARGMMRVLLGDYLGQPPNQVRFVYGNHGKPRLADEYNRSDLRFNLTHSHGLALLAVTRGRDIGVDVERLRDVQGDGTPLAQRFFSARESAALLALPPALRREAFFHCWTRKEAYIKANGKGMSLPLDQFDVSLHPGEPAALLATLHDPDEARRWSMVELLPSAEYVGAVAVEGHSWRLWRGEWLADMSP